MKVWKACGEMTAPVEVECAVPGYPNCDDNGDKMFVNTHFRSEEAAWGQLHAERSAHHSLAAADVRQARAVLAQREAELVRAALLLDEFDRNRAARVKP